MRLLKTFGIKNKNLPIHNAVMRANLTRSIGWNPLINTKTFFISSSNIFSRYLYRRTSLLKICKGNEQNAQLTSFSKRFIFFANVNVHSPLKGSRHLNDVNLYGMNCGFTLASLLHHSMWLNFCIRMALEVAGELNFLLFSFVHNLVRTFIGLLRKAKIAGPKLVRQTIIGGCEGILLHLCQTLRSGWLRSKVLCFNAYFVVKFVCIPHVIVATKHCASSPHFQISAVLL
jgi:hypothetical protein